MLLEIVKLSAMTESKMILKGVDLKIRPGEIHVIMGPNGAGKSTFAKVLAGDSVYETTGNMFLNGEDLSDLDPEERARKGFFLGFQYPIEIPGVSNFRFLHAAYNAVQKAKGHEAVSEEVFETLLDEKIELLKMSKEVKRRGLNQGFSGGEKKRNEILQMAVLDPQLAVLDETDSGLDIDALKAVAEGLSSLARPDNAFLLITHYQRLLDYIKPHFVHVMIDGRIVESGGPDLAKKLEAEGYDWLRACATKESFAQGEGQ